MPVKLDRVLVFSILLYKKYFKYYSGKKYTNINANK